MRVNIYSQEISCEVSAIMERSKTDRVYSAVRFMLHSSDRLHNRPEDDDRSAVTFWLPNFGTRRELIARMFDEAARLIRAMPPERDPED